MSKSKERKQKERERQFEKHGYFGFLPLKDVYGFQMWLQNERGFTLHVTEGNELAVCFIDGRYIRVWYDAERGVCSNRFGMGMSIVYEEFIKIRRKTPSFSRGECQKGQGYVWTENGSTQIGRKQRGRHNIFGTTARRKG